MRATFVRTRLAFLALTAGILLTISGCTSSSSPVAPDDSGPAYSGYLNVSG